MIGLILIKAAPGFEKAVFSALKDLPGVRDIYSLYGEFNFFMVAGAKSRSGLDGLIDEVRGVDKVIETGPVLVAVENDGIDEAVSGEKALI